MELRLYEIQWVELLLSGGCSAWAVAWGSHMPFGMKDGSI